MSYDMIHAEEYQLAIIAIMLEYAHQIHHGKEIAHFLEIFYGDEV